MRAASRGGGGRYCTAGSWSPVCPEERTAKVEGLAKANATNAQTVPFVGREWSFAASRITIETAAPRTFDSNKIFFSFRFYVISADNSRD